MHLPQGSQNRTWLRGGGIKGNSPVSGSRKCWQSLDRKDNKLRVHTGKATVLQIHGVWRMWQDQGRQQCHATPLQGVGGASHKLGREASGK